MTLPDTPASPLDLSSPPLTIKEAARLSGRHEREIKRWIANGVLQTVSREQTWPYRTLIPYDALTDIAKRPKWGTRRGRTVRTIKTNAGKPVPIRGAKRTPSYAYESPENSAHN